MISRRANPEVRLQTGSFNTPPIFGLDVTGLCPGEVAVIDEGVNGYPLPSLRNLPAGDYYVQSLLNIYTEFHRADGHIIWAHMDQWEGQRFNLSPGNLYSEQRRLHLDPEQPATIQLALTEIIPPIEMPADTEWVKHVKIQSKLLTRFWGRPIYLGATILLPRGYSTRPDVLYPVVYEHGHFSLDAPFGFTTEPPVESNEERKARENLGHETGYEFYESWNSASFPRMLAVTLQHPTPYYDNSFANNSENTGPYGDAITKELIPFIERNFRAIGKPYARILTGSSAGGFEALALQLHYPELFGGAWASCPAEIDFQCYYTINIYEDENAFTFQPFDVAGKPHELSWLSSERLLLRTNEGQPVATVRQVRQFESVLGSHGRGAFWFDPSEAAFGPVGASGYPRRIFDPATGEIDRDVANHWRSQDLKDFTKSNWPGIGPSLIRKLHFYIGEMDEYFGNLGVHRFEEFLKSTTNPFYGGSFEYGNPAKGHNWTPVTRASLMRAMASRIAEGAPAGASVAWIER